MSKPLITIPIALPLFSSEASCAAIGTNNWGTTEEKPTKKLEIVSTQSVGAIAVTINDATIAIKS